jgi:hypothetical protein
VVTGFPPENATTQKTRAFSGKVVTGFPSENATTKRLECFAIQLDWKAL